MTTYAESLRGVAPLATWGERGLRHRLVEITFDAEVLAWAAGLQIHLRRLFANVENPDELVRAPAAIAPRVGGDRAFHVAMR